MKTKKQNYCIDCNKKIGPKATRCPVCANTGENNPRYIDGLNCSANKGKTDSGNGKRKLDLEKEKASSIIRELKRENKYLRDQKVTDEDIKKYLLEIKEAPITIPVWTQKFSQGSGGMTGIPAIQLSDWHFGETVFLEQVFHKNKYNTEIGVSRARQLCNNLIDVLVNHLFSSDGYPGIVVCLNGDFFSGDIHDELTATNDKPIMPVFLEAFGVIIWFLNQLEKEFKNVMVFCAAGNHSRTTKKMPFKNMAYTNFDWLLYQLLDKHFEDKKNIQFSIASGSDIQFKIYSHRYRMTHGGQFRGGQGFVGPFAPITRGEIKKRAAAETYGENYNTLIIGHFHQLMFLNRVIVNGSLIGYNEMAMDCNFPYEPPRQALWITHPKRGITINMPIYCDTGSIETPKTEWVSWKK